MFEALYELARHGPLTLAISADGQDDRMTVVVLPKPKADAGDHALAAPLVLNATPAEFDAEFAGLLTGYRTQRQALAEQAEQTRELLAAATEALAKKSSAAVAKAAKGAKPMSKEIIASEADRADDEGDDEGGKADSQGAGPSEKDAARSSTSGSAALPSAATLNLFS